MDAAAIVVMHERIEREEGCCVHFDQPFPYKECEAQVEEESD